MSQFSGEPANPPSMAPPKDSVKGSGTIVRYEGRGLKAQVHELYRTDNCRNWEKLDRGRHLLDEDLTSKSWRYALLTRYDRYVKNSHLHSIVVQSPYIIKFLAQVFDGYPNVYTSTKQVEFTTPFYQFYFRWDRFLELMKQEHDKIALEHIQLLHIAMAIEVAPIKARASDLLANRLIDFEHSWVLFPPHSEVYASVDGHDRLFCLTDHGHIIKRAYSKQLSLPCRYVCNDGRNFKYVDVNLTIEGFDGLLPIPKLTCIPILMHSDKSLRRKLIDRGKRYQGLGGLHHMAYSGQATINRPPKSQLQKVMLSDGRIIIDATTSNRYNQSEPPITFMHRSRASPDSFDDPGQDVFASLPLEGLQMTDARLAICTPHLRGFCLTHNGWGTFSVDNVKDVKWNDRAFKSLVLQPEFKEVVLAFVEAQLSQVDQFDDVIRGKGRGIILLLQGQPGVGKTLTAESVAEEMKRPLYTMSAGELGETPAEVEMNLQRTLELCTTWGAVLLLDECDVFLEKRSELSLKKNKLVAVFLRLLEYYRGVLFLTTNRISAFDPAFESRIHLTIDYPKLDGEARERIWKNFLNGGANETSRPIALDDLHSLSELDLNGRQIKNIVKTAGLLAAQEKCAIGMHHIRTVLKVRGLDF